MAFPRSGKTAALGFRPGHVIWQVFHCDLVPEHLKIAGMLQEDFKKLPQNMEHMEHTPKQTLGKG